MFFKEIELLTTLAEALKKTKDLAEKQEILLENSRVRCALAEGRVTQFLPASNDLSFKNALFALVAIGQADNVFFYPKKIIPKEKSRRLIALLASIDHFYDSLGGIVGYQLHALQHLLNRDIRDEGSTFSPPECVDIRHGNHYGIAGLEALPEVGEIYPIGGLGSRLDLKNRKGEPLPVACLLFNGRTLLEGLLRDVQAREFCYFRLFGKQITTPIALMTSQEKKNTLRIKALCEKCRWFGRPRENFFLFSQLSVPVITEDGNWSMKAPLEPYLQPGGHGALWRTADENGVFSWFLEQDRSRLLIRQINNPIAGLDQTLLALIGVGKETGKSFGFAACARLPDAAEGALVLMRRHKKKQISNIEYTEFCQSNVDRQLHQGTYPANTNILYAHLTHLLPLIKKRPLPRLVLNIKETVPVIYPSGGTQEKMGGRLESMMQNLSDALIAGERDPLETFLTYNDRAKTISTTKRSYLKKGLLETPEGAFFDLLNNAHRMLENECGATLPPFSSQQQYLERGPSVLFLYHPALGPFYHLIAQKIKRGRFFEGSELQAEIADLLLENLQLQGSLFIKAHNVLGHFSQGILRYSDQTGKCILNNVIIRNRGIDFSAPNCYWKNGIERHEVCQIILEGHSEFYAENVTFVGKTTFIVPNGERWTVRANGQGVYSIEKTRPQEKWKYRRQDNQISLFREEKAFCLTS